MGHTMIYDGEYGTGTLLVGLPAWDRPSCGGDPPPPTAGNAMKYDPAIHHRHSIRLLGYDYSHAGVYHVAIVTPRRACLFGEIVDGQMRSNPAAR
jgi:hypothetical protein